MQLMGTAVARREDDRLLRGCGQFVDDISLPGACAATFLRSPHAHALIRAIDAGEARQRPGVLAVYSGADVSRLRLGSLRCQVRPEAKRGTQLNLPPRWPLAIDRVRHVGEPVAMVVAEGLATAVDAAEAVEVDYEPLPPLIEPEAALRSDAAAIHGEAPGNLCLVWEKGDADAVEQAFARAARRVTLTVRNNRLLAHPLEPRTAIGDWDRRTGRLTLYTGSQGAHELRTQLARDIFQLPESMVRVVTPDVGGSFGLKMYLYPEQVMLLAAARELRRPVKWTASRIEGSLSDNHARDQVSEGELALDEHGRILGLRVRSIANMGAYLSGFGPAIPTEVGSASLTGPYQTPAIHVAVQAVFTHTAPVDAYRGAGRPEATYLVERLIDRGARACGLDRSEMRRRNLIGPEAMPYVTPLKQIYDSGEFERVLDEALRLADWKGFEARRNRRAEAGLLAGIGLACFVEPAGGRRSQRVDLRFHPDGGVTVLAGAQSSGMGHETALAQIAAEGLGLPLEMVAVVEGDSDVVPFGRWTSGSRSAVAAGTALWKAVERARRRLAEIAGSMLEAAPADIAFEGGRFALKGTDVGVASRDVIRHAFAEASALVSEDVAIDQSFDYLPGEGTYPNGCHICEVAIDPETGTTRIERYTAVDDFGRVINPLIVEGQLHGGLAQGIGQALLEACRYDAGGQLLTASFLDYAMPRANDLPRFTTQRMEVPCRTNPLGVKGCGEAGAIGAPPAVISAILDALAPLGIDDVAMPATSAALWQAIAAARARQANG